MEQMDEDKLLAEQVLCDFYCSTDEEENFSDYLIGKTDKIPEETIHILCSRFYGGYYYIYTFDEDSDKNQKLQAMIKKMLTAVYQTDPVYLERFLRYHPHRFYYFKEVGVSKKFMEQHFENFVNTLYNLNTYCRLSYLDETLRGIEKEAPEWIAVFETQYDELKEPLKKIALFLMVSRENSMELKKRFQEVVEWGLKEERNSKELIFIFLLLMRAKKIEKIIREEAGSLLLNWPLLLFEQTINEQGKSEFLNLCEAYHAPKEAQIRYALFCISIITYQINITEETELKNYAENNTRNFTSLMKNLLLMKDELCLSSYAVLKKTGVIPKKYQEIWKKQCQEFIVSKLKEFYENPDYTSLFVFNQGKEGDFSGLQDTDLSKIGFRIEESVSNFRYTSNKKLLCLLNSCIFLMREFVEARNIIILFAEGMDKYSLDLLRIPERCLHFEYTEKSVYDYLYGLGFPLQLICKIMLTHELLKGSFSKEEFLDFLKKHPEEAIQVVSDCALPAELYTKYLTIMYEKDEGFEVAPLAFALTHKSKPVVNCAENLLFSKKDSVRNILEDIVQQKNKAAADAALRIIRLWDNDRIEQEMKQLTDQEAFTVYIQNLCTKNHIKNVPYADQIDYGQVRFSGSEIKIEEGVMKFYISEYVMLKKLYGIKACQQIQLWANPYDLQNLLSQIYELWVSEGAGVKYKNIMFPYALCAGASQLEILKKQIDDWSQNSKPGLAAFAVECLAMNGSKLALLMADTMSKKHKNKKVRKAAEEALKLAMEEFKLTAEELEDLIVPDLGFDENRKRVFSYGKRDFEAVLRTDLSIVLYAEGKVIRSLPKASEKYQDDANAVLAAKEELKAVKKQCKLILDTQRTRMERAIFTGRRWSREKWEALFLKNPLMFSFATGLVWEEVDAKGRLLGAFRYMEDGSFNTANEEEYELTENSFFVLLHPADLPQEEISQWKSQLEDYEIVPPVEQLSLPVPVLSEEEKSSTLLADKKGIKIYSASVRSTANKLMCQLYYSEYGECSGLLYEAENLYMIAEVEPFYPGEYSTVVEIQGISFTEKGQNRKLPLNAVPVKLLSFAKKTEEMLAAKPVTVQEKN